MSARLPPDLLSRVSYQLQVARSTVAELEYIRDALVQVCGQEMGDRYDQIPGVGTMKRSGAYQAALNAGGAAIRPSYVDDRGEICLLFRSHDYIRHARKLGIGKHGQGLVLLDLVEHARVKSAQRARRRS